MPKQVFETLDGKTFARRDDAIEHEEKYLIQKKIDNDVAIARNRIYKTLTGVEFDEFDKAGLPPDIFFDLDIFVNKILENRDEIIKILTDNDIKITAKYPRRN